MIYLLCLAVVAILLLLIFIIPSNSPSGHWGGGGWVAVVLMLLGIIGGLFIAHEPNLHDWLHESASSVWDKKAAPAAGVPGIPAPLGVDPAGLFVRQTDKVVLVQGKTLPPTVEVIFELTTPAGQETKILKPAAGTDLVLPQGTTKVTLYLQEPPTQTYPSGRTSIKTDVP